MISKNNVAAIAFLFAVDGLLALVSWDLAWHLRFTNEVIPVVYGVPDFQPYRHIRIFIWPVVTLVFLSLGTYRPKRNFFLGTEIPLAIQAAFASLLALLAVVFFTKIAPKESFSRLQFGIFFGLFLAMIVFARVAVRLFLGLLHRFKINMRRALVVGTGSLARELHLAVNQELWAGYRILGCITEKSLRKKREVDGIRVLGDLRHLPRIVEKYRIEHVFVTLSFQDHTKLEKVMNQLSVQAVEVSLLPDAFEFDLLKNSKVDELRGLPLVTLSASSLTLSGRLGKRVFDVLFSGAVMLFGLPVFALLALGVKLSSPGPVFYRQVRMGIDGRTFSMLKFRSMPVNVEAKSGPKWAEKGESRATRFGGFLRRTSLDELPQFLNVLWGDMSVVGPRPERPVFIKEFKKRIPGYMLRHRMKAGITGWAQVNGWRGNTSLEKRIEADLWYIRHWRFYLDLKIILLTVFRGFVHPNAY